MHNTLKMLRIKMCHFSVCRCRNLVTFLRKVGIAEFMTMHLVQSILCLSKARALLGYVAVDFQPKVVHDLVFNMKYPL